MLCGSFKSEQRSMWRGSEHVLYERCGKCQAVGSSATIGDGASFIGNLLTYASVSCNGGVGVNRRLLALNGGVRLIDNKISFPGANFSSVAPTVFSSTSPSLRPSMIPSLQPSYAPSSSMPSVEPSFIPSLVPSTEPTFVPSALASLSPSVSPSAQPSLKPSFIPSLVWPTSVPFSSSPSLWYHHHC